MRHTVVVTGGASGLGYAVAGRFVATGFDVILLDKDDRGGAAANELGPRCRFIYCDVSQAREVEAAMASAAEAANGHIDVLINNAGIQTSGSVTDTSEAVWDLTLSVNLKGQFLCAKYAIPYMSKDQRPVVINVSSVNGIMSQVNGAAYVTSKAAILGLTNSIAVDYAPWLRCVAVCPGAINTPMTQADLAAAPDKEAFMREMAGLHLLGRMAEAGEVAAAIFYLASPEASFITGHYLRVDGGIGLKL